MTASVRARTILAEALGLGPDQITDQTALGVSAEWNSLAHLRLILALEEATGARLTPDQIVSIASYSDVAAILPD